MMDAVEVAQAPDQPWDDLVPVTPDDNNNLPGGVCRGLYAESAGTVVVVTANGQTRTRKMTAFQILPLRVQRVKASGTTVAAGDLAAGY